MRAGVIPAAIARQPWGIILPLSVLTLFGSLVLYSAAGGSFQPWALQHLIRFGVFLIMAMIIAIGILGFFLDRFFQKLQLKVNRSWNE